MKPVTLMRELDIKLSRIYELLDRRNMDALYLQRNSSFAFEVLTEMAGWPTAEVNVGGQLVRRPLILEA